jgi:hypothetical protein
MTSKGRWWKRSSISINVAEIRYRGWQKARKTLAKMAANPAENSRVYHGLSLKLHTQLKLMPSSRQCLYVTAPYNFMAYRSDKCKGNFTFYLLYLVHKNHFRNQSGGYRRSGVTYGSQLKEFHMFSLVCNVVTNCTYSPMMRIWTNNTEHALSGWWIMKVLIFYAPLFNFVSSMDIF